MSRGEMIDLLRDVDEVLLLELLGITSSDLVDAFLDKIEENENNIRRELMENA